MSSIFSNQEKIIPTIPPGQGVPMPALGSVPAHVAIIMDGNGRWANSRGLPRTEGHKAGELALMDTLAGAVEAGVKMVSVYAFSTENWKRSPAEVRFLMGYSRDVIRRRSAELNDWNVQICWSGREKRLWRSVVKELEAARELTANNNGLIFNMCINYGGQAEITDAVKQIAQRVTVGDLDPEKINEKTIAKALYQPRFPEVDLLIRTSGEQRLSNFMLWQCAYAELSFSSLSWPEFNREALWAELQAFGQRDRRFGKAVDQVQSKI